jgi:hypothetical protein
MNILVRIYTYILEKNITIIDNSNSSDTSSSSLSSASRPTPLSSKKYDSYRNESSKSSNQLTRLSEDSNTNIGLFNDFF